MHSYHRPRRIKYALGLYFVAFGGLVRAQGTLEQCTSPLTPAPCSTLKSVMAACAFADSEVFVLSSLTSQSLGHYSGPEGNATTLQQCQCTDVGYNLYSACAACQAGDDSSRWSSRDTWFLGCNANHDPSLIAMSSSRMPSENISIWMTQIYSPSFNLSQAVSVFMSGTPLPTNQDTPPTQEIPPTETISADSGDPSSTVGSAISANQDTLGSKTNTTPIIVGAVVGAFALLAIIALGIFFLRRRQKQHTAPSAEFMKYSQVNAGSAREPLRAHSRANTADEDMNMGQGGQLMGMGIGGGGYKRQSAIRLDSVGTGEEGGDIEMTEGGTNPPPFTPGLFKDPIFEKGVALNLAAAAASSGNSGGGGGGSGLYGASPITYSPATPSTQAHVATQFSERHGLIHGRQDTL